jgi:response regulator RpfG family c-di-GMP phosphodiesterase
MSEIAKEPYYVLVMDDDEVIVELITRLLGQFENCRTITAFGIREAESKIEQWNFQLALLDWNLPDGEGLEICRRLKTRNPLDSPMVVMITGYSDLARKIYALEVGADDFLSKPIEFAEFRAKIRSYLRIKDLQNTVNEERKKLEEINAELEREIIELTRLLTQIMEHRLPNVSSRVHAISDIARWIAEHLSVSSEELKDVEMAGLLHEVGKLALPDPILNDPTGQEDETRFIQYRQYPTLGELSLSQVTRLKNTALIVRHQLENFDGTGTPDHLQCTEIPLGSRILRVAIDYVNQCCDRKIPDSSLMDFLDSFSGSVYDPQVLQQLRLYIQLKGMLHPEQIHRVSLLQLQPGMILAQDVVTISGIKLVVQNARLDQRMIDHLQFFHETDPIIDGSIYVFNPVSVEG